jgi:hypothetical protein
MILWQSHLKLPIFGIEKDPIIEQSLPAWTAVTFSNKFYNRKDPISETSLKNGADLYIAWLYPLHCKLPYLETRVSGTC